MNSISSILDAHAAQGRTALIFPQDNISISYKHLANLSHAYASCLYEILSFVPNITASGRKAKLVGIFDEWTVVPSQYRNIVPIAMYLGLIEAGFVPTMLNTKDHVGRCINAMKRSGVQTCLYADKPGKEAIMGLLMMAEKGIESFSIPNFMNRKYYQRVQVPYNETAPAVLHFTSGSTSEPKGALVSQKNILDNTKGLTSYLKLSPDDNILHFMPMFHCNGMINQLLSPLICGSTVVLSPFFLNNEHCKDIVRLIQDYNISHFYAIPYHYDILANNLKGVRVDNSLRFLRTGSFFIEDELHRKIEDIFQTELLRGYGSSETTCTIFMNPLGERRYGTVGKPIPGTECKIFKSGTEIECAPGEVGEICTRGLSLMLGYASKDPSPVQNGWLRSKDEGFLDADGYLHMTGYLGPVKKMKNFNSLL